jgi:hypothetical protein
MIVPGFMSQRVNHALKQYASMIVPGFTSQHVNHALKHAAKPVTGCAVSLRLV